MELTDTEYKVAGLVAAGFSEKEIASKLFVSPKTVHNHTYNIRKKWNARNGVDVARKFILNLDNPKQFFAAALFLSIQFFIVFESVNVEVRRASVRTVKVVRAKNAKRNRNEYYC
ncbi:response regulator transcription factor [Galbibacter sp. BG1]|uniref:response regulator transcription factor n=1 Tax=Galbibacter sp. BG1 TaxID=1170699 RepID=UPI0015BE5D6E|nr:LuxR C-terminal-related transcriptional regulator [Galbibacter sp. BG1]QLE02910.1 response regulator transcription factor [Galbibacter sp. BG1]